MKKYFNYMICIIATMVISLYFVTVATAQMRIPIQGAGWHYPSGEGYSEWETGNVEFDENLFNQYVIDSFGWQAKNIDEIKDLLPPFYYIILKNPDVWGPRRINVTAYIKPSGPLWDRYKFATEKFNDDASIDNNGWIENYTAGCPFPEPKTGYELIWNYKKRFGEDDRVLHAVTVITNRYGEVRYEISIGALLFFDGRLTNGTAYRYEPNESDYARIDLFTNADPDLKGTLSFIAQYNDCKMPDTFWCYLPSTRRVHNICPVKERTGFQANRISCGKTWIRLMETQQITIVNSLAKKRCWWFITVIRKGNGCWESI
jgi:uncharacterized protein DUF1329